MTTPETSAITMPRGEAHPKKKIARTLKRSFYTGRSTLGAARSLLGKILVVPDEKGRRVSARIVEVEAYLGEGDRAAHSFGGLRTKRTEIMFGTGGTAYVFLVYGMYHQFNVVLGPAGVPHVALIRGVEPVENIDVMRARRGVTKDRDLTSGPGKLCIALGIDRSFYGEDLRGERIWLEDAGTVPNELIASGRRIGIDYAGDDARKEWRFWIKGNDFVSR